MQTIKKGHVMEFGRLYLDGEAKAEGNRGRMAIKAEKPSYREIKDEYGRVIDYLDVRIQGHANTFNLDRGGDQVIPGAFLEKLEEFLTNPVLQSDHDRGTFANSGHVEAAYEDGEGLAITAVLSNSPSERMRDLRFKVVEGDIRTLSIGGKFFGKMVNVTPEDSRFMINKVELREISIVTVPMNKESLFEVKEDEPGNACTCGACHEKTGMVSDELAEGEGLCLVDEEGNETEIIFKEENQNG